jgi:hypothetical protein
MRSHSYALSARQCSQTVAAPILGAALLALGLQTAVWLGRLPPSKPSGSIAETLVTVKSQLTDSRHPAQVIFLGDSSCTTGIDVLQLRAHLPNRPGVLNLGLFIGFGLDVYGQMLSDYVTDNPDQLQLVVLLVTPRFLTDQSVSAGAQQLWRRLRRGGEDAERVPGHGTAQVLGIGMIKDRLLRQVLHEPIPNGRFYGFLSDFAEDLTRQGGSMIEPGQFHPPAHPNLARYSLAPTLERASRDFHGCLPAGAKLAIGITPVPESLCSSEYLSTRDELLLAWNRWIGADFVLTNAPVKLPDPFFATADHPNPAGQALLTRKLALLLAPLVHTLRQ